MKHEIETGDEILRIITQPRHPGVASIGIEDLRYMVYAAIDLTPARLIELAQVAVIAAEELSGTKITVTSAGAHVHAEVPRVPDEIGYWERLRKEIGE